MKEPSFLDLVTMHKHCTQQAYQGHIQGFPIIGYYKLQDGTPVKVLTHPNSTYTIGADPFK